MSVESAARALAVLPDGLALVALGANLGERKATLDAALERLDQEESCEVALRSSWHATAPVGGPPDQPEFLNGAALLYTTLGPEALLELLHQVEAEFGRERGVTHGPRTLDLDLLMHGSEARGGPELFLPHPRFAERSFVLAPVAELCPELELRGKPVSSWLASAQSNE
jgi:2-amino-4-hydroxy-6-hydroxymethyldihydropteridine diphosphokinase